MAESGSNMSSDDGFDFHHTSYENKGGDDKGTRTSSDWKSSGGGWNKESSHNTDQNVPKGGDGRHPK
jgi:hypothetical protein